MQPELRDSDLRAFIIAKIRDQIENVPDTRIIEELGLCQGSARVDVAVVNGSLHGYELKSDLDDLNRFPNQIDVYSKTLERVTLVVTKRHLANARRQIPKWWGIIEVSMLGRSITCTERRRSRSNPKRDPFALAQLLWKREAIEILKQKGLASGLAHKPREAAWKRIASALSVNELSELVLRTLKTRTVWRSG